ncbi:hypothetical protein CRE_05016 [Caenorhabditis remanei]|uniref:Seven TM Receptor n=1 Tax=Caenorhabditis remanei TaxID=31234 RepID=E3MZ01_CAERE|nr:hypothetical protein CRE_05016 [Caenorhabditis remanei]
MNITTDSSMNSDSNDTPWPIIISRIQRGSTCFGMLTNFILILLIWFKSPKNFGVYKYLMIYVASFEVAFGVLDLLTVPDMYSQDSAFFVMVDPRKSALPESFIQVADLAFCGAFGVSLAIFGVQFAYRYFVLTGHSFLATNKHRNFVIWLGSPILFASVWTFSCATFMGRNDFVDQVLREDVLPNKLDNLEIDRLAFVGVIFFPKQENSTKPTVNLDSFYAMGICSVVLSSTEFIMFFFAIKTYLATKRFMAQASGSTKLKRLQWQLFYATVSQSCIPIFFMQIPITAIYISTFFNSSSQIFGQIQAITVSFYLATDALPTIFIIKPYRETILNYFRCIKIEITFVWPKKRKGDTTGGTTSNIQPKVS